MLKKLEFCVFIPDTKGDTTDLLGIRSWDLQPMSPDVKLTKPEQVGQK